MGWKANAYAHYFLAKEEGPFPAELTPLFLSLVTTSNSAQPCQFQFFPKSRHSIVEQETVSNPLKNGRKKAW